MTPQITIIIVSYNTRQLTLEAIRSLREQTVETSYRLIVVDNRSDDGSPEAIESEFPDVTLLRPETNLGFAAANNLVAETADTPFILLLNPDTIVLDHAIDRLVAFAHANPDAGIWGGRTLYADRSLNPTSCWRRQTPWSLFCRAAGLAAACPRSSLFDPEGIGGWSRDSVREVDIVTGCFLLIRTELWHKLRGFDPAFFMYGEEADLCLRARAHGARPVVTPDATIVHYGGASERVRADKIVRVLDAKCRLIRRHWPTWQTPFGIAMMRLWTWRNAVCHRVLARLGRGSSAQAADEWTEVFQRRREWTGHDHSQAGRKPTPTGANA